MKTALEILKETHEELSSPNPADWKSFDVIMSDGTGEVMLKAMERYAAEKVAEGRITECYWCKEKVVLEIVDTKCPKCHT